ncbi:hypothetical protein VM95_24120 [Streptomyces rubellomurinus]|uniref:Uncharacterized protein n=1 Tax=Streptomyces rubellomurinus (strain ATCC 31215) TaxID=359131 RepID=A0A0F2TE04_STRR3|nr:hypothetical protein VM95_24120 [Streptomyces rubellomurinus]
MVASEGYSRRLLDDWRSGDQQRLDAVGAQSRAYAEGWRWLGEAAPEKVGRLRSLEDNEG